MATFTDLTFETHPNYMYGFGHHTQAKLDLANGYSVSVITGDNVYGKWEVAIFDKENEFYYDLSDGDVAGCYSEQEVTNLMQEAEKLQ